MSRPILTSTVRQIIRGSYYVTNAVGDYDINIPGVNTGKTTISFYSPTNAGTFTNNPIVLSLPNATTLRIYNSSTTAFTIHYELVEYA